MTTSETVRAFMAAMWSRVRPGKEVVVANPAPGPNLGELFYAMSGAEEHDREAAEWTAGRDAARRGEPRDYKRSAFWLMGWREGGET